MLNPLNIGFVLMLLQAHSAVFGQTLGKIKAASDDYNSSDQSESSYSEGSTDYYYDQQVTTDTYYDYSDYGTDLYDSEPYSNEVVRRKRPEKPLITSGDFSYRRALDNRKVMMSVIQFNRVQNHWFYSFRYNQLSEHRPKETETFSTVELQFFGYHSMSKPLSIAIATGRMYESYSKKWFWENLIQLNVQATPALSFRAEGRLAMKDDTAIRSEGTLSSSLKIVKWEGNSIDIGVFYSASLYYEKVPVENLGFLAKLCF